MTKDELEAQRLHALAQSSGLFPQEKPRGFYAIMGVVATLGIVTLCKVALYMHYHCHII